MHGRTAFNYNENACFDDGSCVAVVLGCTDPLSFNFDLDIGANTDDGSCVAVVLGCTDESATNFDSSANTDNNTCLYAGCTDNAFAEYYTQGFLANSDNGSCSTTAIFGCVNENFSNFNSNANVDSSLDPSGEAEACFHVYGCTDEIACNYNSNASLDDGTCLNMHHNSQLILIITEFIMIVMSNV